MASFTLERRISAPPEVVFDVLTDHCGYARITSLRRSVLEREGASTPNGVGAIRALSAVGPALREEVLAYEPPSRFSYKLLSGLPSRDHVGTVELSGDRGETKMTYAVRLIPTVPLLGAAVVGAVRFGVGSLIDGVAKEAERRSSGSNG